jgi:hypothetical protein
VNIDGSFPINLKGRRPSDLHWSYLPADLLLPCGDDEEEEAYNTHS